MGSCFLRGAKKHGYNVCVITVYTGDGFADATKVRVGGLPLGGVGEEL